ncbi:hypothetical protein ACIRPH_01270 [Nocardiopsis sp. NPDC101807]|uniref:hypothetical protein n=1 Tax=Nocardiopsis sp. NPDC101807 TaxID=3364339 RepID=UPI0038182FC2
MIQLSFTPPEKSSPWSKTWDSVTWDDPAAISEIDLRYKYFGVNFEMVVDDVEIVSKKRFVTLVDLALSLSGVMKRISSGEDAAFGFTESDEVIHLICDGNLISVTSSKSLVQASVGRKELLDEFSRFLREVHYRLVLNIPGLSKNPVIWRFYSE